jgi:hypothetical protein
MEWWDVNSLIEIQLASMNSVIPPPPPIQNGTWQLAKAEKDFTRKVMHFSS